MHIPADSLVYYKQYKQVLLRNTQLEDHDFIIKNKDKWTIHI